jgi:hypothetical protein
MLPKMKLLKVGGDPALPVDSVGRFRRLLFHLFIREPLLKLSTGKKIRNGSKSAD